MNTTPRPLSSLLDDAVGLYGDSVALRMGLKELTYRELDYAVDRCAGHLAQSGVGSGSRVGLSAGNGIEFVAVVLATMRLGAVIVMISTAWRDREVAHAIEITAPTHLVHDGSGATNLDELVRDRPVIHTDALGGSASYDALGGSASYDALGGSASYGIVPTPVIDVDDLAVMVFSSGTTGMPKAVCHSHRTMYHGTLHWVQTLGLTNDDRLQIATPPFHILGLLNLFAVVAAGASVRLHRRFDLDAVLTAVQTDRITIEMAVAPIALAMASHASIEEFDLSSLRYIMWGATPVTPSVAETVTRRTGVRFLPAYGASELPVLAVNPVDRPDEWRLDSVGIAPIGVELRVVDIESGQILGPGETGELHGRSASMMLGYLPEDANGDAIVDGWYRTGDVGALDADGWVTITDRVKEMIKVNGFQVAPAEIETMLLGHPDVVDCAVFGVPDNRVGEAVIAAVVRAPSSNVTADDLRSLVARELASYKRISHVQFLDQIPRLPSGKVLRRELKANYRS